LCPLGECAPNQAQIKDKRESMMSTLMLATSQTRDNESSLTVDDIEKFLLRWIALREFYQVQGMECILPMML